MSNREKIVELDVHIMKEGVFGPFAKVWALLDNEEVVEIPIKSITYTIHDPKSCGPRDIKPRWDDS